MQGLPRRVASLVLVGVVALVADLGPRPGQLALDPGDEVGASAVEPHVAVVAISASTADITGQDGHTHGAPGAELRAVPLPDWLGGGDGDGDGDGGGQDGGDDPGSAGGGDTGGEEGGAAVPARPRIGSYPGIHDRWSGPRPRMSTTLATTTIEHDGQEIALAMPAARLPWRLHLHADAVARFGHAALVDAIGFWDDRPGSRWSVEYAGTTTEDVDRDTRPSAVDVVFLLDSCPDQVLGYAYYKVDADSVVDVRHGSSTLWMSGGDIGICPAVANTDQLTTLLAHEVGHITGMAHLCEPGQDCWRAEMGDARLSCRIMYGSGAACTARRNAADDDAIRHLYPALKRIGGRDRTETAARASYASHTEDRAAPRVVIAPAYETAHLPLAAAALAGPGAPLVLAHPDPPGGDGCVGGAAREELARVASTDRLLVQLVGTWPAVCDRTFAAWADDVTVQRIADSGDVVARSLSIADAAVAAGAAGDRVLLVSTAADADGHVPDGIAAGAAAGASGGVVLYTGASSLDGRVERWLTGRALRGIYLLGGERVLASGVASSAAAHAPTVRLAGASRIETAVAVATEKALWGTARPTEVALATAAAWPDAVTAATLGATEARPVLLTWDDAHPANVEVIRASVSGGRVIGATAAVSDRTASAYGAAIRR